MHSDREGLLLREAVYKIKYTDTFVGPYIRVFWTLSPLLSALFSVAARKHSH